MDRIRRAPTHGYDKRLFLDGRQNRWPTKCSPLRAGKIYSTLGRSSTRWPEGQSAVTTGCCAKRFTRELSLKHKIKKNVMTDILFCWPQKQDLFGIGVTIAENDTVLNVLFNAAQQQIPATVEHLAVNNLITGVRKPVFREMLNHFDLVTVDGQPIRFALRLLYGLKSRNRVTARELMSQICARAARTGHGIYLYGDEAPTLNQLRLKLGSSFPGIRILGSEPSVFRALTNSENTELVRRINASGATFVFIGLGCPIQEEFVFNHRQRIRAVQLCVGSAFKFLAGERRVAPVWMQRFALEWVHRLAQDPSRLWRRYLYTNSTFLYLLGVNLLRNIFWKLVKSRDRGEN